MYVILFSNNLSIAEHGLKIALHGILEMLRQQGPIWIDPECLKSIKNETFTIGIVCIKYFSSLLNYLHVKNYMGCHYWEELGKWRKKHFFLLKIQTCLNTKLYALPVHVLQQRSSSLVYKLPFVWLSCLCPLFFMFQRLLHYLTFQSLFNYDRTRWNYSRYA